MFCVFLESDELTPEITTLKDFNDLLSHDIPTAVFVISHDIARFITDAYCMNLTIDGLQNCYFSLNNGQEFFEFNHRGHCYTYCEPKAEWHVTPAQFIRSQWLANEDLHSLITPEFITSYSKMFPCLQKKKQQFDLLFTQHYSGAQRKG